MFKRKSSLVSVIFLLVVAMLACESDDFIPTTEPASLSPTAAGAVPQPSAPPQLTLPPSTKAPASGPTAAAPSATAEVSQKDGYFVVVAAIEDPAKPSISYKAESGKRLIAVEVVAGNISGNPWVINTNSVTLLGTDGQVYKAGLLDRDGGELPLVKLGVGERVRGWISFKIPTKAVVKSIKWELSVFTDSAMQISLAQSLSGKVDLKLPERVKPKLAKLGEVVEQSGYSLAALSLEDPTKAGVWYVAEAGKRLVAVEIVVTNVSGRQFASNFSYASVVDKDGFVYAAESRGRDGQLPLLDLNPGEKAKGWVSFKIPEKVILESIKLDIPLGGVTLQAGLEK